MAIVKVNEVTPRESRKAAPLPTSGGTTVPAQLVVYGPGAPTIVEGVATWLPDGSLEIEIATCPQPAIGTPVQVVVYGPGQPLVYEGASGSLAPDGSFEILVGG